MNESYLFRGKRKDNGEWLIGDLSHLNSRMYIFTPNRTFYGSVEEREVDPSTIGRCVGFRDLKGILVFEGDRLSDGKREYIVIYSDSSTGMAAIATDKSGTYSLYHLVVQYKKAWVVGNIHDRRPNE